MKLLDGKHISSLILKEIKEEIGRFSRPPGLGFILVGSNPASKTYVASKKKRCQEVGIASKDKEFPDTVTESELLAYITSLNKDPSIDGILLQLPLPLHLSTPRILEAISPEKDVDGFHPLNAGKLLLGESGGFYPCTPYGISVLLTRYNLSAEGKHVVILGRSNIVGKPLAALLMQKKPGCNATVTIAHSQTKHLTEIARTADILVAALGCAHFVKRSMVKEGAIVVDVGINRLTNRLVGDVDFEDVAPHTSYITPVPGGVGPMTIAMLLSNTILSYKNRNL